MSVGESGMTTNDAVQVLIIGGGPARYTAAMYAARGGLSPVVIEGHTPGGQFRSSGQVNCFPSYPGGIAGSDLADRMREQAASFGARLVPVDVESVDLSESPFTVVT